MTLTSRFGSPYTYNSKATICTQFLIQCRHKYRHTYSLFSDEILLKRNTPNSRGIRASSNASFYN